MKRSTRIAYLFILLFFIFFNGLLVYLILERISEAKNKFGAASSNALFTALADYNELKSIDSASQPTNGWLAFSRQKNCAADDPGQMGTEKKKRISVFNRSHASAL